MQHQLTPNIKNDLVSLAQRLVRIKSYSGQEEQAIRCVQGQMKALGYDDVTIDAMGNIVGRIGIGERSILFDAHVDTVEVRDAEEWKIPPFSGDIIDGYLHGRGAVDMKSGAAAAIYAGIVAKKSGYLSGKSVYVSCTVSEEDCDGENLKHLFTEFDLKPDYVVICEPSNNRIALGHKGKAQISIKTYGVSAHGSAPEKGKNAIYEMADIIRRVEETHHEIPEKNGLKGTLIISRISSMSASLNAVPTECEIYLDRRLVPRETKETVRREMAEIIKGKDAAWKVGTLRKKSWTGLGIQYEPFHPAWRIDPAHELSRACISAYGESFGRTPVEFEFWDFSTNAVTPVSMGIPTIGFGPGDHKLAHMRNERCSVTEIVDALSFYTNLIHKLSGIPI